MRQIILIIIFLVFGFLTSFQDSVQNTTSDSHNFTTLDTVKADSAAERFEEDIIVLYLEEVQVPMVEPGVEQLFSDHISIESIPAQKTVKSNTQKKNNQQELTRIRTKLKIVEKILKKAVIKSYHVNGQTEGLQLNGLGKISEAKALFLKSGDIILAVNGQRVGGKKEAYNIFKKARKKPIMIVDLLQDGVTKKLLFDFRGAV